MARTVTLGGSNYTIPEPGDSGYDQTLLTNYLVALATGFPQLAGGLYSLAAELDLGVSFGVKMLYAKSETANPASAGVVRLAKTDVIDWRNNANAANLALGIDTGDALTFNGANVTGNPMLSASTAAGQSIPNATPTIVVFGTVSRDSDSAYSAGTGRYTIPAGKGGDYLITSSIRWNASPGASALLVIFINGVGNVEVSIGAAAAASQTISAIINLAAGAIADIRLSQSSGGAVVLTSSAGDNWFHLKRIPT